MNNSKYKLLVIWNVVLSTLLLLTIGVAAVGVQAANDPPVEIFTANLDHAVAGTGTGTTTDITISSTSFQTVLSLPVNFTGQAHNHHCLVVASANLDNPATAATGIRYDVSISLDGSTSGWAVMPVEMHDHPSFDDPDTYAVTTSRLFTELLPSTHTIGLVARKEIAGNPSMKVLNSTLSVICVKKLQTLVGVSEPADVPVDTRNDK